MHLLITDVVMPEMGATESAGQLGALRPGIKVVLTSGYSEAAIARQDVLDPAVAFIQKPYRPKALARKIREVLRELAPSHQGPRRCIHDLRSPKLQPPATIGISFHLISG